MFATMLFNISNFGTTRFLYVAYPVHVVDFHVWRERQKAERNHTGSCMLRDS